VQEKETWPSIRKKAVQSGAREVGEIVQLKKGTKLMTPGVLDRGGAAKIAGPQKKKGHLLFRKKNSRCWAGNHHSHVGSKAFSEILNALGEE